MAIISDIGGTSQSSFSINGKTTLFQGDDLPNPLMGNNGDVYFKSEGLLYIKRNNVWEEWTKDSVPDARSYQNRLLYSNGENYEMTEITYNDNSKEPHQLELFNTPNTDYSLNSKIVPNIGWINDPEKNNVLHKSGNESKTDTLSLKNKFGTLGDNSISSNELDFTDNLDNINASIKSLLNTLDGINIDNNSSILELSTQNNNYKSSIKLFAKNNGETYATAPTPSANASNNEIVTVEWLKNLVRETLYPIDSIYITVSNRNPTDILGIGTWSIISENRVLQGVSQNIEAGNLIEPGIPDITGFPGAWGFNNVGGAFYEVHDLSENISHGDWTSSGLRFKASLGETKMDGTIQNNVYGKSNTVQPAAYTVHIWRRIA